jgi:hypothetical protein
VAPDAYAFNYDVHDGYSGAYFNADEQRNGYSTSGSYSVALPDGRVQTVNYRVADANSGYVADVHYSGVPLYPAKSVYPYVYRAAPTYQPVTTVYQSLPVYHG